jgi:hypothetical protein
LGETRVDLQHLLEDLLRAHRRPRCIVSQLSQGVQEAVAEQLTSWGDVRPPADIARRRSLRPLERDLATMLAEMAEEFPLLASLMEKRAGGQKRLPIGGEAEVGSPHGFAATSTTAGGEQEQRAVETRRASAATSNRSRPMPASF